MNVRSLARLQIARSSSRSFRFTVAKFAGMEAGVTSQQLEEAIKTRLSAVHTQVKDISGGCGQSYEVVIVSPLFEKKMTLARHRLVNTALKDEISRLHAFTQKSYTPAEWETQQSNSTS